MGSGRDGAEGRLHPSSLSRKKHSEPVRGLYRHLRAGVHRRVKGKGRHRNSLPKTADCPLQAPPSWKEGNFASLDRRSKHECQDSLFRTSPKRQELSGKLLKCYRSKTSVRT